MSFDPFNPLGIDPVGGAIGGALGFGKKKRKIKHEDYSAGGKTGFRNFGTPAGSSFGAGAAPGAQIFSPPQFGAQSFTPPPMQPARPMARRPGLRPMARPMFGRAAPYQGTMRF